MLLIEPASTPYDWNFRLFSFPVRVSPWFWLMALLLGGSGGFDDGIILLTWVLVVFLSILIHELGHAFAYRAYGMSASIVLYQMGGMAVSDRFGSPWQLSSRSRDPRREIMIALAGPGLQIASALLVMAVVWSMARARGMPVESVYDLPVAVHELIPSRPLVVFLTVYVYISVIWAVINLLPVFPLDGGQIARNLFLLYGGANAIRHSLMLSLLTGAAAAIYGFTHGQPFLGILFAMLAYGSYQALTMYGGFGGWRY